MEAVPRLPMISFELKVSDPVSFGTSLKQYIASFYHEDPESYNGEIQNLESLRSAAVRPSIEVASCQMLKKYYCQLHFLKARFPMEEGQAAVVYFPWKNPYSGLFCSVPDIKFELMCILFNIGALHTQLGAEDSRISPDGMKMSCTHFQCAAWAFQTIKESYTAYLSLILAPEIVHFMQEVCLAQAQECILEKSMMDNRKATIIAKVSVQVEDYYKQALSILKGGTEEGSFELMPTRVYKRWSKYLNFKVAYHRCLSLLYHGQQAEEQQKMGERVAFYQAACNQLEEARKLSKNLDNQSEIDEALSFTLDVVEGKRKAAKNENEFIYHEEVPEREALTEVKGASLVKGIPFNIHDTEVSGPDIFGRLVPMEAHEASSVYSEQKAEMLRRIAEIVEQKDQQLAEYMSSLQLDFISQMHQATGLPQDIVDRAAALSAKPDAIQDLVNVMSKLSGASQDVESMLAEMEHLIQTEKRSEEDYQKSMGSRPPSIVATDLSREAAKYKDAHTKASDSNINLHKAMSTHISYLKILSLPLSDIQKQIPSIDIRAGILDESTYNEVEALVKKVDEMKAQRAMLFGQLREEACKDDITGLLVTRQPEQPLEQLFQQELQKHQKQAAIIEANLQAQDNILRALTDAYARFSDQRKLIQDILNKRSSTITALMNSYSAYDDLIAKANKGVEFYTKLETNISKLLQRIKSTCKVQEEEREQILGKNRKPASVSNVPAPKSGGPKLRDYLDAKAASEKSDYGINYSQAASNSVIPSIPPSIGGMPSYDSGQVVPDSTWIPSVRPAPVGSEKNNDMPAYGTTPMEKTYGDYNNSYISTNYMQQYGYPSQYGYNNGDDILKNTNNVDQILADRLKNLGVGGDITKNYASPEMPAAYPSPSVTPYSNTQSILPENQYPISSMGYPYGQSQTAEVKPQTYPSYPSPSSSMASTMSYPQPGQEVKPQTYPEQAYPMSSQSASYSSNSYPYAQQKQQQQYQQPQQQPHQQYQPQQYQQPQPQQQQQQQYYQSNTQMQTPNYASTAQNYYTSYPDSTNTVAPTSHASNYGYGVSTSVPAPTTSYSQNNSYGYTPTTTVTSTPSAASYPQNYGYGNVQYSYYQNQDGFQQYYNAFGAPNQNPVDPNSQYSTAGMSSQTTSTSSNYDVHYGTNSENYYNVPYGYQGINADQGQYQNLNTNPTYMDQGQSSMTYMQSNANGNSTTIPSITSQVTSPTAYPSAGQQIHQQQPQPQEVKSASSATNIDLLAGLDFSVSHPPLEPQPTVKSEPVPAEAKKEEQTPIEQKPVIIPVQPPPVAPVATVKTEKIVKETIPAERVKRRTSDTPPRKDPFLDPEVLNNFVQEIEKFEKFVDGLSSKTLNGPTPLELKWKEIQTLQYGQEETGKKLSISVARCYPMKNRFPDILPYDDSRVELKTTKDDYINASHLKRISPHCPPFIVTQEPLAATVGDFWTMIWEQESEIIVCLLNDTEVTSQEYWPVEVKQNRLTGKIMVTLESINVRQQWTERVFTICSEDSKNPRTVTHFQLSSWPVNFFPTSPASFLSLINGVLQMHQQQRDISAPIVVHCQSGIGRSGLFCLVASFIVELAAGQSTLPDLVAMTVLLSNYRKNILKDREYLKFGYQVVLYHAQEFLMNRGILTTRSTFDESRPRTHTRHPSQDLLRESLGIVPSNEGNKNDVNATEQKGGFNNAASKFDPNDPLSSLDPLWTIRKNSK